MASSVNKVPSFEIELCLGKGGMAEVHLARMLLQGKRELVALKRIRPGVGDNEELVRLFDREARISSLLQHENVVRLEAYGWDEGGPYLALEFVDGQSAHALLKAHRAAGKLCPLDVALSIARDAARGLAYAHAVRHPARKVEGIVHRDISPDNVLISYSGIAKLADFGIAKSLEGTSFTHTSGAIKGKYGFMAPEIFDGHGADALTDYFALAVTIFELVCAVAPFQGRTEAELLRSVLHAEPLRMSSHRAEVPHGLDFWVFRCLSKDRSMRPKDLSELLAVLDAALGPAVEPGRMSVARCLQDSFPAGSPQRQRISDAVLGKRRTVGMRVKHARPRTWALLAAITDGVFALSAVAALGWPRPRPVVNLPAVAPTLEAGTLPAPPDKPLGAEPAAAPAAAAVPAPPIVADRPARAEPSPPARRKQVPQPSAVAARLQDPVESAAEPASVGGTAVAAPGLLWVRVRPWAKVFVDGESKGVTPLAPISLPPGRHAIILVNEELGAPRSYTVQIEPQRQTELKAVLDAP